MHLPHQHQETCAILAVVKFTVLKKTQICRAVALSTLLTHHTTQKPWTVEESSEIKLEKQHFDILINTEIAFFFILLSVWHSLMICSFKFYFQFTGRTAFSRQWTHRSKAWTTLLLKNNLTLHTEGGKILHFPELGLKSAEPEEQYTIIE